MSAEPLSREEREGIQKYGVTLSEMYRRFADYEATVQAAEERSERLRGACKKAIDYARTPDDEAAWGIIQDALAADDAARGGR